MPPSRKELDTEELFGNLISDEEEVVSVDKDLISGQTDTEGDVKESKSSVLSSAINLYFCPEGWLADCTR